MIRSIFCLKGSFMRNSFKSIALALLLTVPGVTAQASSLGLIFTVNAAIAMKKISREDAISNLGVYHGRALEMLKHLNIAKQRNASEHKAREKVKQLLDQSKESFHMQSEGLTKYIPVSLYDQLVEADMALGQGNYGLVESHVKNALVEIYEIKAAI